MSHALIALVSMLKLPFLRWFYKANYCFVNTALVIKQFVSCIYEFQSWNDKQAAKIIFQKSLKALLSTSEAAVVADKQQPQPDYSDHPLVLGDGFHDRDIRLAFVNNLNYRQCGLMLISVNFASLAKRYNLDLNNLLNARPKSLMKPYKICQSEAWP